MYHVIQKRARFRAPFAAFNAKVARAVGRGVPLIIMIGFILGAFRVLPVVPSTIYQW